MGKSEETDAEQLSERRQMSPVDRVKKWVKWPSSTHKSTILMYWQFEVASSEDVRIKCYSSFLCQAG